MPERGKLGDSFSAVPDDSIDHGLLVSLDVVQLGPLSVTPLLPVAVILRVAGLGHSLPLHVITGAIIVLAGVAATHRSNDKGVRVPKLTRHS